MNPGMNPMMILIRVGDSLIGGEGIRFLMVNGKGMSEVN